MRRALAIMVVLAVAPVAAQPAPCDECTRGDALIDRYSLHDARGVAGTLAGLTLSDPLTTSEYAAIVELRRRTPALIRVGAIADPDLVLIAAALCHARSGACTTATARALQCLADRCEVAFPETARVDVIEWPENCNRYVTRKRSPRLGLGFDWATGYQRSKYPVDGAVWSLGVESRLRLAGRIGAVARVDRSSGRDEAIDTDGNGTDDQSTGLVTRITALAGPAFILDFAPFEEVVRSVRLDLLGGYMATRSQADEAGPAAGFDLAFHMSIVRLGLRVVQGFGGASEATMVMGHLGFVVGNGPEFDESSDCGGQTKQRRSRIALGLDWTLGGYGITKQLGQLAAGIGVEAYLYVLRSFDLVARADLNLFPGDERDRVIHQALLLGVRWDHGEKSLRSNSRNGFFSTYMVGHTHGAALADSTAATGPIADVSLAWGIQSREGGAYVRLHGRFGLLDNTDYRALFLSAGLELRLDPDRWRPRI